MGHVPHIPAVALDSQLLPSQIPRSASSSNSSRIVAAAKAAQAHEFILAMPRGYDSVVEARGANLSGGQKQRLAIARALLVKPGILILDDSTSAVDLDTEFRIQRALDKLMTRCTTFIVAQRINSVLNANKSS